VLAIVLAGLAARMHPLRQSGLRLVERPRSTDVLSACPTCLAGGCAAFPAKFKFKLGQAGQYAGHHAARDVRRVNPFTR
jgi:hypothetical protein